ncbi:MAG: leucine-rich repeat domain-containing protein [Aureispira sp.]|nr:leucine-rich repeat domain-containing protein [Aureispira sp.]
MLEQQKENIYSLIETWDKTNITLALQMAKANRKLWKAVKARYRPLLRLLGKGSTLYDLGNPKQSIDRKSRKPLNYDANLVPVFNKLPWTTLSLNFDADLPWWATEITRIQTLVIKNGLTLKDSTSAWWTKLTALTQLYLEYTNYIPSSIGDCTSLKILDIIKSRSISLPKSIGQCVLLEGIYVENCDFLEIPSSINQCAALEFINSSYA